MTGLFIVLWFILYFCCDRAAGAGAGAGRRGGRNGGHCWCRRGSGGHWWCGRDDDDDDEAHLARGGGDVDEVGDGIGIHELRFAIPLRLEFELRG